MAHGSLILRAKWRMARNSLKGIQKHMYVHLMVGMFVLLFFVGGGTGFFYWLFDFLMRQEVFGPPLMDSLVGIVFLAFFSMLVFSNLIITLSTSYISREVDFLMNRPISYGAIFRQKLIESMLYSSWAFAFLSLPLFVAFGASRDVAWYFYPMVVALIVPFLLIPAALGAMITLVVTAFLPARRTRTLSLVLGILAVILALVMAKALGLGRLLASADQNFLQIMALLEVGSTPVLPSAWMTRGVLSIGPGVGDPDFGEYFYWLAMLSATALFLLEVSSWLAPKLYFRGWCLSKDSTNRQEVGTAASSPFVLVDKLLDKVMPRQLGSLFSKDLKTFWRDPSQWTQLVILFGLMIIYIANLRTVRSNSEAVEFILSDDRWRTILAFFNLGATCFILSILTTRFIYPLLSLEGRGFWSVGLAPMKRTAVVWQKYGLCLTLALLFSVSLQLFSNAILQVEPLLRVISVITIAILALGLTSLSVGIGALMPNFKEDNPARIANGLGGTANALLSLFYIGLTVATLILPVNIWRTGSWEEYPLWATWGWLYILVWIAIQAAVITLPMAFGLRRWRRMEF
ncbi:MAG: hypothetical protein RLY93_19795 [Sumerlaeia bacterium]